MAWGRVNLSKVSFLNEVLLKKNRKSPTHFADVIYSCRAHALVHVRWMGLCLIVSKCVRVTHRVIFKHSDLQKVEHTLLLERNKSHMPLLKCVQYQVSCCDTKAKTGALVIQCCFRGWLQCCLDFGFFNKRTQLQFPCALHYLLW